MSEQPDDPNQPSQPAVQRPRLRPRAAIIGFLKKAELWNGRTVVLAALVGVVLWRLWYLRTAGHWDFRVYYWAAQAQQQGLDPYNLANLSRVAGQRVVLPYLYPPGVLYLLRPLTWLPLDSAIAVFVGLKVACLVGLMSLWRAVLGPRERLALFVLVVLGFSDAVFNDFFAGNVATFEALALWAAFYCLLRQRVWAFVVLVVLASVAKMTPLAFLGLVLLTAGRRRFLVFGTALAAGLLVVVASFGGRLSGLINYVRIVLAVDERGPTNSAILPMLKDVAAHLRQRGAWSPPPEVVYGVAALVVVALTAWLVLRIGRRWGYDRDAMLDAIMGAVVVYVFVLPRMKDYSYCLVLPVVVFLGRRIKNALPLLIVLVSLTARNTLARYTLGDFPLADLVWRYFNLVLAGVLWLLFVFHAWERGKPAKDVIG